MVHVRGQFEELKIEYLNGVTHLPPVNILTPMYVKSCDVHELDWSHRNLAVLGILAKPRNIQQGFPVMESDALYYNIWNKQEPSDLACLIAKKNSLGLATCIRSWLLTEKRPPCRESPLLVVWDGE